MKHTYHHHFAGNDSTSLADCKKKASQTDLVFMKPIFVLLILFLNVQLSIGQSWSANAYLVGWFGDANAGLGYPINTPNATPASVAPGNAFVSTPMTAGAGIALTHVTEGGVTILRMANVNSTDFAAAVTNDDYITATITVPSTAGSLYRLTQALARTPSGITSLGALTYNLVVKDLTTNVSTTFLPNVALTSSASMTTTTAATPYNMVPGRSYELRWYISTGSTSTVVRALDNPSLNFQSATAPVCPIGFQSLTNTVTWLSNDNLDSFTTINNNAQDGAGGYLYSDGANVKYTSPQGFKAGDFITIRAKHDAAETRKGALVLSSATIGVTFSSGPIMANAFSNTAFVDVTYTIPAGTPTFSILNITGETQNGFYGQIDVVSSSSTPCVDFVNNVFIDANNNSTKESGENIAALSTPLYVNLVQGGVVMYSFPIETVTGIGNAYSVSDGSYQAVITSSPGSITTVLPQGVNTTSGTQSITVTGGVVNSNNALYFPLTLTDTDNDGIGDIVDIDDDNDGVLDTLEATFENVCNTSVWNVKTYSNFTDAGAFTCPVSPIGAPIGTGTKLGLNFAATVGSTDLNNFLTQVGVTYTGANDNNRWLAEFEHVVRPEEAGTITYSFGNCADLLSLFKNSTSIYCGGYPDINGGTVSTTVVAGDILRFYIAENDFLNTWMNMTISLAPNGCSQIIDFDTDSDNIPNRLDLDSDGDGCSDAYEAGATTDKTANFVFNGAVGTNGLVDSKETVADNGIINYTSTYSQYAISNALIICTDTDNDGIGDLADIDDDNDGILDTVEGLVCNTNQTLYYQGLGSFAPINTSSGILSATNISAGSGITLTTPSTPADAFYFRLDNVNTTSLAAARTGNDYVQYSFTTVPNLTSGSLYNFFHCLGSSMPFVNVTGYAYTVEISNDGGTSFTNLLTSGTSASPGVTCTTATGTYNTINYSLESNKTYIVRVYFYSLTSGTTMNFNYYGLSINACTYLDTDGDNIPNHLDLDSDGDGCSDAYEAGATTNTTANYAFVGAVGANGLTNSLETTTESGVVNYTVTYGNATNNTIKTCPVDTDGDGVTDAQETTDGTDPNDPCELILASVSQNATSTGDCDGDGVTNAAEINGTDGNFSTTADNTNPLDPCDFNVTDVTIAATSTGDCDGDGVTNALEINGTDGNPLTTADNTDATDPCDYNTADQVLANASSTWLAADCDGDGNPNSTDPNTRTPTAINDTGTAPFGSTTSINILGNDDFLPNDGNNITNVGTGTAGGTIVFDPVTGELDYTPLATEVGSTVTVIYQVCQGNICATATVTITIPPADHDNDGIADADDLDDDNDGILDTVENAQASTDTDGDGIPNSFDLDSDNDGILDIIESGNAAAIAADTNGDGELDPTESAPGANGVPLAAETTEGGTVPAPKDQDGDGKPDPYDLDSDNDGINDLTESGNAGALAADTNGDGTLSTTESPVGVDGVPNVAQVTDGGAVVDPVDTDTDGVADFRDLDSDNDGINDITEAGVDPDPDGNGLVENPLVDTDNDGIADSVDANDGVFGDPDTDDSPDTDVTNGPATVTGTDPDGDGILGTADGSPNSFGDAPADHDNDGIADADDLDDDNDGILDTVENAQANADTDGDGIPNSFDLDSDNDGILDIIESGNAAAIAADTNGDGELDPTESAPGANGVPLAAETTEGGTVPAPKDQDGDGKSDPYDLDSDNDGINDLTESGNAGALTADTNGDGTLSTTESPVGVDGVPNVAQVTDGGAVTDPIDTDTDGVADFRDLDSDNDGINDITEAGVDPDTDGNGLVENPLVDTDNDGIADSVDANDGVFGDPDTTDSPAGAVTNGPATVTGTDPDGDGILGTADGSPNSFGDAPADHDNDGIADADDLDDDNDGILDTVENAQANADTDGDGIPNSFDLDSDNDGILDLIESGNAAAIAADTNGDGELDPTESAPGANGVPLAAETTEGGTVPVPQDQDGDGKPDAYDLDSDNDGINDLTESGNAGALTADTNGDGTLSTTESPVGVDGVPNVAQVTDGGAVTDPIDTDTDGVADFRDLDSDNDGINDITEAGVDPDTDGNGLVENPLVDTDNDGIADSVDANDGVFGDPDTDDSPDTDVTNGPATVTGTDPDGDGILGTADGSPNSFGDAPADHDNDGIADAVDLDDDNDGILDTVENAQANADTDGDGIPNSFDLDSDNDGILDIIESGNAAAIAADTNGDGELDPTESAPGANGVPLAAETTEGGTVPAPKDQDGDGKPDPYDLDSDNDGINDLTESGNAGALAADTNGDGTLSTTESPVGVDGVPNVAQVTDGGAVVDPVDTDTDGVADFRDLDSDNDGINDITEAGVDPDTDGNGLVENPLVDTDNDGIADSVDANDGVFGDPDTDDSPDTDVTNGPATVTGTDPDGDGILGTADGSPNSFGDAPADHDNDGIADAVDLDDDNDGILDTVENAQANADTDGDGIPNSFDLDSDNDGILDIIESGNAAAIAADTNGDGELDPTESAPGANGVPLAAETTEGGMVPAPKDQDGDGKPDPYDLDSDNDGINDLTESGNAGALAADTNGDGTLSTTESPVGVDGVPNVAQVTDGGAVVDPVDTDTDGVADFRDLDSDNDGINDITEAGVDPDTDGNGLVENPLVDTDNDGIADSVDANDGVFGDPDTDDSPDTDVTNGPATVTGTDPDGDGILGAADGSPNSFGDAPADHDNDGIADADDLDDDNDGILDTVENAQANADTDGDGIPNSFDLDSDNDGILDIIESGNAAAIAADTNGDGELDPTESAPGANGVPLAAETTEGGTVPAPKDQDGDGKSDPYDLDSDNDGINDLTESGNAGALTADTNGDGTLSTTESPVGVDGVPNVAQVTDGGAVTDPIDTDTDGVADFRDLDSDNDGINDITEAGVDPDTDGNGLVENPLVDTDNDGIADSVDANDGVFGDPDTTDSPAGAVTNGPATVTGTDPDGDGILGTADGSPNSFGDAPADHDNDGIADADDLDDDNDGILDTVENAQANADTDGDGIPNSFDLDSDNDGILDLIESGNAAAIAADTNGDGELDPTESAPGANGVPLAAETTEGGTVPAPKDQDGDGKSDPYDLDSDNDGINDLTESGNAGALTADTNGDGTLSTTESPVGVDGVPNVAQVTDGGAVVDPVDTDTDGVADFRDLDSDNDGINDITEAGVDPDSDGNGLVENPLVDTDNDGIADSVDANDGVFGDPDTTDSPAGAVTNGPATVTGTDPDGDGILGTADGSPNSFGDAPADHDNDGIADADDLDDDNDGILDTVENAQANADTDGDGIPNSFDLDSDNDGILDIIESGNAAAIAADTNGDGELDPTESAPGANGVPLAAETTEGGTVPAPKDQDGDGKPDPYDLDSDNDGINDLTESGNAGALTADTNGDGTLSTTESPVGVDGVPNVAQVTDGGAVVDPVDTDTDGVADFRDLDSDNDGINDIVEAGVDPDTDGNGLVENPLVDTDNDGIADSVDANDSVFGDPDTTDSPAGAVTNGPATVTGTDPDGDGILGTADGLPNSFGDAPCTIDIGGTVYEGPADIVGITGTAVNGDIKPLYVTLFMGTQKISFQKVKIDGTYKFENQPEGTYTVVLGNDPNGSTSSFVPVVLTTFTNVASGGPVVFNSTLNRFVAAGDGSNDGKTTITADCNTITYSSNTKVAALVSYLNNDFQVDNVSALPLDLLNFTAVQFDDQVNLNWKTANETAFSHFEVQKSINAKEFGSIGSVKGTNLANYNLIDKDPAEGVNYYRLKMVDVDGTSKLSNVITVNFKTGANFITVENPANNGEFKVMTNLKNPRFTLLNTLGQVVEMRITEIGSNNFVIKSNSVAGVYYLNIVSNNKVVTRKVIMP